MNKVEIHPNHKQYLDNLTQDIGNKPLMKTALISHLYRAFKGLTRDEAREIVTSYITGGM